MKSLTLIALLLCSCNAMKNSEISMWAYNQTPKPIELEPMLVTVYDYDYRYLSHYVVDRIPLESREIKHVVIPIELPVSPDRQEYRVKITDNSGAIAVTSVIAR